ncbi:unnamed protein product [Phyllotreta striolata]|uniref:Uncharacterized protein n=1 Tax=Phyllotreta striolata TaxID=444603 RepID=A0A9P0GTX2_PHYSR|nr:unnamed protein product [Phyllotreta striolata]
MQGLFATLDDKQPKWKLGESSIGTNPGLGFRPISNNTKEGSLIWYNLHNSTTSQQWINLVEEFLQPYNANQSGKNFAECTFESPPEEGKVCKTTSDHFGPCTPQNKYGYNSPSPCVFLKLNRIIDWTPRVFNFSQAGMPPELADYVDNLNATNSTERMVWVSCNGVTPIDKEHIKGFNYSPRGFASYYYPYKNVDNYLSPIVAVQIVDVTPNVVIQVECRAWADNIKYVGGSLNRAGSVTFEIQVDKIPVNSTTGVKSPMASAYKDKMPSTSAVEAPTTVSAVLNASVVGSTTA